MRKQQTETEVGKYTTDSATRTDEQANPKD